MRTPSLLLLLAVAAIPAAADTAHRCDVEWLRKAQGVAAPETSDDPDVYLTTQMRPEGTRTIIDIAGGSKLCDATVWRYVNDPAFKPDWDAGLSEQAKILLAVDALYQDVDALGRDALTKADDVVDAAVKSGVVVRKDGAHLDKLKKAGLTGDSFAGDMGYGVEAAPPGDAATPADLGPAVLAFRTAVTLLANELAARASRRDFMQAAGVDAKVTADFSPNPAAAGAAKAAFGPATDASYQAALKFLTDPSISSGDDDSARDSAALSRLDYGLRNLIALRAAAVEQAAAPRPKAPADALSAKMAKAVLEHLNGIRDYQDLNALYDKNKGDAAWLRSDEGKAVAGQLNDLKADAAATSANGRLEYSVGGKKAADETVSVADLAASPDYRETIADSIAQDIVSNPFSAEARAALAAFRGAGAPGTPVVPSLTPDQKKAAEKLPPPAPAAPQVRPYDALLAATPAPWFFDFSGKENVARYYSKANAEAAAAAAVRSARRRKVEEDAAASADDARLRDVEARRKIETEASDPDDSPRVAEAKRKAALAEFDKKSAGDAAAARKKVLDAARARGYEDSAAIDADRRKRREELDATVDAAYSDGIAQAIEKLNSEYKTAGDPRRSLVEKKSGYEGEYYRVERVDRYFKERWGGVARKAAIDRCKAALGFKKDGDGGDFKDPSVDNVDKICGVSDGLAAMLVAYRGTNDKVPVVRK